MSSEIFINITKEKKEMTNVQLENEIDCKNRQVHVHRIIIGGKVIETQNYWKPAPRIVRGRKRSLFFIHILIIVGIIKRLIHFFAIIGFMKTLCREM
jgi:hypothetical protein